jgi:large subunit ribosomal protein L21
MYAIVEIGGQQFKIEKDQKLYVNLMEGEEGKELEFDQVLLLANGENIQVGKPLVDGARVKAKVLTHVKSDKVLVFKKKRRKGYQKMNGHRQPMTQIQIEEITA